MSSRITRVQSIQLKVAAFERPAGYALAQITRTLKGAGYGVTSVSDHRQFPNELPGANCALVVAYQLRSRLIPRRLDGAHVPPTVLISTLSLSDATQLLKDPKIVYRLLEPAPPDRMLVGAVTGAVITDIFMRIAEVAARHAALPEPLRLGIRNVVREEEHRVKSLAHSVDVSTGTLDRHWRKSFGQHSPNLKDFCRAVWFLRVIRAAANEPVLVWSRVQEKLGISRSTLRRTSLTLTGDLPSDLDITAEPAPIIRNVCVRAIPEDLLRPAMGDTEG